MGHGDVSIVGGCFHGRRPLFPAVLVAAIEARGFGPMAFFDIVSVRRGQWGGLAAIGLGATLERRKKAGKVALGVAALLGGLTRFNTADSLMVAFYDGRSAPVDVDGGAIALFGGCINRTLACLTCQRHRHWDVRSRRQVEFLLLCQKTGVNWQLLDQPPATHRVRSALPDAAAVCGCGFLFDVG